MRSHAVPRCRPAHPRVDSHPRAGHNRPVPASTLTTWGDALAAAKAALLAAAVPDAELDATLLVAHVVGQTRTLLHLRRAHPLEPADAARIEALVARRAAREPLPYVLGTQEFCGLPFSVDPRVLIPRWDSEVLAEHVRRALAGRSALRLADLGTGSGALALTLAAWLPAHVWAVDLDPDALALAQANAATLDVGDRVSLVLGDLGAPLLDAGLAGTFDALVANLPYIPTAVCETLEPEVRDHEPRRALDGGPDGLDLLRRCAPQVEQLLRPGGLAVLEHGDDQGPAVRALFAALTGLRHVEELRDLGGRPRAQRFDRP